MFRLFTTCALTALALVASACGAASDLSAGESPTTIPLFDSTETTAPPDDGVASTAPTTTAPGDASTSSVDASPSSSDPTTTDVATTTTSEQATTTTADPYGPYCAVYNQFVAADTSIDPTDPEATAALVAAQEAAWIELASLAPPPITADVAVVRDFTIAFRALLADVGFDVAAAIPDVIALEADMGVQAPRIRVEQFGLVECGTEPDDPEDETAVFYASLLDTADRRNVLVDLLSTDGVFTPAGAECFVERATVDMMFPLAGASATDEQTAALSQALGVCQLTLGGS